MQRVVAAIAAMAGLVAPALAADFRQRLPQDEVVYFLLPDRFENGDASNDRGGIPGDRLRHGFDAGDKGFYNGGDLKGVTSRLAYLQDMGVTAIWLGPVYRNRPVQGQSGRESAGYHGYWITDFTDVDPHLGTRAELKTLVEAAHGRGMKVYLDIITNHTADVIRYRECPANDCVYRGRGPFPFSRRGGIEGTPINAGFDGSAARFSKLVRPDYAWTPFVPKGLERAKTPAWLNDPIFYHNRGETTFKGESSRDGDFAGLDDLMTEHPRVVAGMIDIYGQWIDDFGIDGFRIDTARHVNPEFWQAFVPAMQARAAARGIPNFHVFGEVFDPDPAVLARFTRVDRYPAVLDFAFQAAVTDVLGKGAGTDRLARLFDADALYEGGEAGALGLPTFLGNHDMGRLAWMLREARPGIGDDELLARIKLGHAMMFLLRGQPVIYSGDEQGFAGTGGDQSARAPLFASAVPEYRADRRIGGGPGGFDAGHPLYREVQALAAVRAGDVALRRGLQRVRLADAAPGLFAVSRQVAGTTGETLVVFNTSMAAITAPVEVDVASARWRALLGACPTTAAAPGSLVVTVPALATVVCEGGR
ncbi:MAG: alpha-amylase [Alphaproteobacteria bacterium]|nr:MAG: alpha-amylase [Alphaproteobacteria bacterium]